ncbi:MAG: hypothetical protein GY788_22420 [bacterium]|nr:hypothetical protein [bacterium]
MRSVRIASSVLSEALSEAEEDCAPCAYAREHGWWGPDHRTETGQELTHCRDCHRSWPMRSAEAHCKGCCQHFKSPRVSERHRIAEECHDPRTLVGESGDLRFRSRDTEFGETWVLNEKAPPSSRPTIADGSDDSDVLSAFTPGLPSRAAPPLSVRVR